MSTWRIGVSTFMCSTYDPGSPSSFFGHLLPDSGGQRPKKGDNHRVRSSLAVAATLALLLLAGCDGGDGGARVTESSPSGSPSDPASPSPSKSPKKDGAGRKDDRKDGPDKPEVPDVDPPRGFEVVSAKAWTRCNAGPPLKGHCPTVVPKVKRNYLVESFGTPGGRFGVLEMSSGAPRDTPEANRPPDVSHIVLEAGPKQMLIDFGGVTGEATLTDDLLHQTRSGALLLGKRTWGGVKGRLILAEPFPGGGAHGDHLVFQWKRGEVIHRISSHSWVPATRAQAALKTIVKRSR